MGRVAAGAVAAVALGAAGLFGAGGASAGQAVDTCGLPVFQVEALAVQEQPDCSISIDKTLLTEGTIEVGDEVTFRITVENTGNVGLYGVGVVDEYPAEILDYGSSDKTPVDEDPGLIVWEDEDGETFPYLDPEDSVSFTVTFIATDGGVGQNCVFAYAMASLSQYEEDDVLIDNGEESVCARFSIDEPTPTPAPSGGSTRRKTPTATAVPAEPTPVSTVAGATAVPPQPTPRVGITLPDTGTGSGTGGGGEAAGVLAVTFALVAMTVGAAWTMRRRAAR